jgi:hypothetical protein
MVRTFILSLLLAAFVGQGWAQSGMAVPAEPASQADCPGQMEHGAGSDCCPEGTPAAGACASVCSAAFALATFVPEVAASRDQFHSTFSPAVHASPRYLPLNPPPIA